jgi:succinoglycan biosynthesis transport protein ExoP
MELRDYLRVARKRAWLIVTVTFVCAGCALTASLATIPIYQGTAKLIVVARTDPSGGVASAYEGALLSQQLVKSFAQILESRTIAETALRLDPQPFSPAELQQKVHAEPVTGTLLIHLSVQDTNAARARRLTNSVARAFMNTVPTLQSGSALRVSMVEPALTPGAPIKPRTKLNVALGLLLGLTLGIGLAFLREFMDRSIKTPRELESAIDGPVVGTIPPFKASKHLIPVAEQPRTAVAEAFRKLRTNFAFLGVDRESQCYVITSPAAGDGKSTVAANLAIALAQTGQRVAVIDADLRKPSIHKLFRLSQRVGTTTVLLDRAGIHDAIQHPDPDLPDVLTSGQLPPNPSELLGSRRMEELLAELKAAYEVVLVDCPPLLPVTDPMVVSRFADGVFLVIRAGVTTRDQAEAAKAACLKAGAKMIGAVLNASPVIEGDQPAYYSYYGEAQRTAADITVDAGLDVLPTDGSWVGNGRAARLGRGRSGIR